MHTFRPLAKDAQVLKLVNIMETDRDRPWHPGEIHDEYKRRHPDDPKKETRGAGIRNQLQRYCRSSKQYQTGYPPLFVNLSKAQWRSAPDYQILLLTERIPNQGDLPTIAMSV
jgi:hypothetical protein